MKLFHLHDLPLYNNNKDNATSQLYRNAFAELIHQRNTIKIVKCYIKIKKD